MKKEKIKINIKGKECTARFNISKLRFEHNFGYKDNNGVRQSRIITGTSIEELTKNIESFQELIEKQSVHSNNISLDNYIEYYLDNIAKFKNRKGTISSMKNILRLIPSNIKNTSLNNLTTEQLQIAYSDMSKKYAINTVSYAHQCVNTVLNYAVKSKLISRNVNADCIVHSYVNGKKVYISVDDISKILSQLKTSKKYHYLYRPVLFLAVSGVRIGECLGLRKDCIDVNTGIVHIKNQVTAIVGYTSDLKTKASNRTIQLSKDIIDIITQYDNESEFVFTSPKGLMWTSENFHMFFRKAFNELGYSEITPKQFRNSFVKNAVKDNVSLKIIQNILGHSKLSTTMDIYGELTDSDTYIATKSMCSHFANV